MSTLREVIAFAWEERQYNGTMRVADSDEWTAEVGFEVPQYGEPAKWIRNVRPLIYGDKLTTAGQGGEG